MKRWTTTTLAVLVLGLGVACDKADGAGADDEFVAAIPEAEMLTLSMDEQESVSGALGSGAGGDGELLPQGYRVTAQAVMSRLNALVVQTHAAITQLTDAVEPVEVTKGATTCRTWEGNGPAAHWSFVACLKDKGAKKFGFVLKGRPLDATSDDEYLVVLAGEGKAMPAWNGKKRGMGRVGYNFDNLAALNGAAIGGRLGIAYRAVGMVRALNLGLDEVVGEGAEAAHSGVYRFHLVVGKGGRFTYVDTGDVLARDEAQALVAGQDGLVEWVRAAAAWRTDGFARTVRAACGGTVGENECVRVAQCWDAGEELTWELLLDEEKEIAWEPTACKEVPLPVVEEPGEGDVKPPKDKDADSQAPILPEPEILPDENE